MAQKEIKDRLLNDNFDWPRAADEAKACVNIFAEQHVAVGITRNAVNNSRGWNQSSVNNFTSLATQNWERTNFRVINGLSRILFIFRCIMRKLLFIKFLFCQASVYFSIKVYIIWHWQCPGQVGGMLEAGYWLPSSPASQPASKLVKRERSWGANWLIGLWASN